MLYSVDYNAVQVICTGRIYFKPPEALPETVEFRAESVHLRSTDGFSFLSDGHDAYVTGRSTLFCLRGIYAARMELTLYDPERRMPFGRDVSGRELHAEFLRDSRGELVRQEKNWGEPAADAQCIYKFEGTLDEPIGFAKLSFHAAAGCTISFDTDACMSAANMREEMRRDPWVFMRPAWR